MKNWSRIVGVFLFLSLYLSAIVTLPVSNNQAQQTSQNSFQKKQSQISVSSHESIYTTIDVVTDNVQNTHPSGLKKQSVDHLFFAKAIVSQENSKFKQYSAIWHNQLIASRKTDQLYPHHTFG